MEKYPGNTIPKENASIQVPRRSFLINIGPFFAALVAGSIAGRPSSEWLGKWNTLESSMVDAGLAPDLPTATIMLKRYRDYIKEGLENDNNGISWNKIREEYGHDELKIFQFLLQKEFFSLVYGYSTYKNLSSRVARSKKR